ncbi:hypothetical protein B0J14DRAFT_545730 [Halenospora varia]|nr:hypothetical protein B0J14DRAFT_545730 [Halenospora varia]
MPIREIANGRSEEDEGNAEPKVDIVAVHGLNPLNKENHAFDTWQKSDGTGNGHLWLRDTFPTAQPNARIFLYSYDSRPTFSENKDRFIQEASLLLEWISVKREKDPKRPLIFIGHSLGGILIKQALVNAHANPEYREVKEATRCLAFFGTPHGGPSDDLGIRFAKACVAIVHALPGIPSNDIMEALKKGSLFSDVLQENWRHQLGQYSIVSFYEGRGNVVPRESATIGLPGDREKMIKIDASHSNMCRFDPNMEEDCDNYELVERNLKRLCDIALRPIRATLEKDINDLLASLRKHAANPRALKISEAHHNTFEWIWTPSKDRTGFTDWLTSDLGLLWLNGKPGSGKSTLIKYLATHTRSLKTLQDIQRTQAPVVVPFYFSDQGAEHEKSFVGFLHSIIYQILFRCEDLRPLILPIFEDVKARSVTVLQGRDWKRVEDGTWTQAELESALEVIIKRSQVERSICLFIDGLDECSEIKARDLDFLSRITSSQKRPLTIKACIASRPLNSIQLRMVHYPSIELQKWTTDDISTYVFDRLDQTTRLVWNQALPESELDQKIIPEVVKRASGIFTWVKIAVDELSLGLEQGDTSQELFDKLSGLPSALKELYTKMIDDIPDAYLHDTCNYFRLILSWPGIPNLIEFTLAAHPEEGAKGDTVLPWGDIRPHKRDQICRNMRRRLQSRCKGLLDLVPDDPRQPCLDHEGISFKGLSFTHGTAKSYVTRKGFLEELEARANQKNLKEPNVALALYWFQTIKYDSWLYKPITGERSFETLYLILRQTWDVEVKTGHSLREFLDDLNKLWENACLHLQTTNSAVWHVPNERLWRETNNNWSDMFLQQFAHKWGTFGFPPGSNFDCLAVASNLIFYIQDKIEDGSINGSYARQLVPFAVTSTPKGKRPKAATNMVSLLLTHHSLSSSLPRGHLLWGPALQMNPTNIITVIRDLLERGASPNEMIVFGAYSGTALHQLVSLFSGNMGELGLWVQEWLDIGGNFHARDSNGDSVLDLILHKKPGLRRHIFHNTTFLEDEKNRAVDSGDLDFEEIGQLDGPSAKRPRLT